jgi:hypothetical protein
MRAFADIPDRSWNSPGGLIDVQLIPRDERLVVKRAGDQMILPVLRIL